MSEPEGFLSRWTRRKSDAAREESEAASAKQREEEEAKTAHPREGGEPELSSPDSPARENERSEAAGAEPKKSAEPEFDLSKLPSIDSITADTDIRPFLMPGVPRALTQAALRRAWVADPKIRDFIEIAENQWDFTAPGVPGFDLSAPAGDIKQMLAQIIGRAPQDESPPADSASDPKTESEERARSAASTNVEPDRREVATGSERDEVVSVGSSESGARHENEPVRQTVIAQHNDGADAAQQNDASQKFDRSPARRTHGSAMPR